MSHLSRFDTRFTAARSPDKEEKRLSVPSREVIEQLLMMRDGDTLQVDHVGDIRENQEIA
jgi:hypothetical protein